MTLIPFDKREGHIWFDGQIIAWQDACIHMLTHGLHYGGSVFEGIRVYNGKPFKYKEHNERLLGSAKTIGFEIPYSKDELNEATLEIIEKQNIENGYVRPVAWRGSETMLIGAEGASVHTAIAAWQSFEGGRNERRERGMKMCVSEWRKPPANSSPYSAKAACIYTLATMVKKEADSKGCDDALMLDQAGNITEGTTSNFFAVFKDELCTPIPDCFLNGITRQTIIKLAKDLGIKLVERHIKLEELKEADAAFLTGTAIEIMPIETIEEYKFDIKHPLVEKLMDAYSSLVNS